MIEWMRPAGSAKLTSATAATPPKLLVRCSTASSITSMPDQGGEARHQALGQENHDQHQDRAERHHLVLMEAGEKLRQAGQDDSADDGAKRRGHAAEHDHGDQL